MNSSVVKRTQDALGKVIKKPPLTEKLLSKPPFRYLHDIITEVIRMTGFMKGLYTDSELKSDNVKDKDAKISFLQKTIDVVIMVSGEPLSVKPARIVAGHEPERTNELLQAIGKCCLNKLSSDEAVKRVLAGEKGDAKGKPPLTSKSQEQDNKEVKEEEPRIHKEKEEKRNSEIKDRSASRERKQREEGKDEESKQREKDRDKEREKSKENDRERHKDPDRDKVKDGERDRNKNRGKQEREREKSRDKDRGPKDRELERDKEKDKKNDSGKEKERLKERDREREKEKGKDKDRDKRRERVKDGEHTKEHEKDKIKEQEKTEKKAAGTVENLSKKYSESTVKDPRMEMDSEVDLANRVSRSLTSKGSRWRSKNSAEGRREDNVASTKTISDPSGLVKEPEQQTASPEIGDSTSDAEGEVGMVTQEKPAISDNTEMPSELASGVPPRRIPRPGSARPAPPRIKRQESAEVLVPERTGNGKMVSNVIIDSQNSDDEEDSQFVVEAAPQLSEMPEMDTAPAVELEDDEKHGGLVKKILETKKDYEKLQQSPKSAEKDRPLLLEAAWKKEKDIVSKEIEKLRTSIQTLCRSALPLGKIMDYIQEDMDAMQNELQLWHSENKQHAEALQKEQSITDCAVEPLKAELVELEQLIKDQQDKICAVKANILKNEEKIQKMVYSINISSRR
ncbi:TRAF3-interacting protein 1 isoform X4 [Antechinus flavipes]|uniref:TRAF3-interacting protein 1 isoform X4 n=1 Tax=Antechinus flavipes TaxID=38775 RepID=UPI0022367752|nr:TRAF3-interacting protein 1 isoform X4 [Antechinus flavipes]